MISQNLKYNIKRNFSDILKEVKKTYYVILMIYFIICSFIYSYIYQEIKIREIKQDITVRISYNLKKTEVYKKWRYNKKFIDISCMNKKKRIGDLYFLRDVLHIIDLSLFKDNLENLYIYSISLKRVKVPFCQYKIVLNISNLYKKQINQMFLDIFQYIHIKRLNFSYIHYSPYVLMTKENNPKLTMELEIYV